VRLYLASHDRPRLSPELGALVGERRRTAVIANANDGLPAEVRRAAVEAEIASLAELDLDGEELDLRDYRDRPDELAALLSRFGLVWARGGNAFVLNRAIHRSGLHAVLPDLLRGGDLAYGGYSAGAVVATPTLRGIELVDDADEVPPGYSSDVVWDGLGLVDYSIAPHYRSEHRDVVRIERVVEFLRETGLPFITLADRQSLVIDGEESRIVDRRTEAERLLELTPPPG